MTPAVRAVFFDAVGTLIHPEPPAAAAYHAAGLRHGSRLPLDVVTRRFADAFRAEEVADARNGHRTDEERERLRWRRIVAAVLDDVSDREACYADLYDHFARPSAWRCEAGAGEAVARLRAAGYVVGIASNFDQRLRGVVAGLPELAGVEHLAISSEIGWKKPAAGFYSALAAMTGLSAEQVLIVGDDFENDFVSPRRYGMRALLFDPHGRHPESERIGALAELAAGRSGFPA